MQLEQELDQEREALRSAAATPDPALTPPSPDGVAGRATNAGATAVQAWPNAWPAATRSRTIVGRVPRSQVRRWHPPAV